jgi:hypothetical protein
LRFVSKPMPLSAISVVADVEVARPLVLRSALFLGCAGAVALGLWLGSPQAFVAADPDLARLLRGMALIKASIVVATLSVVAWRLGHPVSPRLTAVYLGGAWAVALASTLIWQLTHVPLAALGFHGAELAMLVAAFGDGRGPLRTLLRPRSRSRHEAEGPFTGAPRQG